MIATRSVGSAVILLLCVPCLATAVVGGSSNFSDGNCLGDDGWGAGATTTAGFSFSASEDFHSRRK